VTINDREKYGITRENIFEITKIVSFKMTKIKEVLLDEYDIKFSKKNLSEIIGKIFEKETAEYLDKVTKFQVLNAQKDKDPDLCFISNGEHVKYIEIKVTSTNSNWRGGEFSKRPYDYLLISWGGNFDNFFVAYTHIENDDWISSISKGYYAPIFKVEKLYNKIDKVIFIGKFRQSGKSLIRENINQTKLFINNQNGQ